MSLTVILLVVLVVVVEGKYMEGELNTGENWSFLARFCFLSLSGMFEYDIEYPEVSHPQKRFIYRLLTRHDFLPVWLVADK
jgi:hypothetical protein